ncbi:MAG: hypothetical protein HY586_04095, partial [Candidatus Omnitrophica bacterium]|nr:hypothetical protein [Candidatus Omnitrophota bacterium]
MMKGNLFQRLAVLVLVFLQSSSGATSGWSQTVCPRLSIELPSNLGTITRAQLPSSKLQSPVLIHIEDAHAQLPTQQKIREILHYLTRSIGVRHVFIEGASGPLEASWLNIFPDRPMNRRAAEYWMGEGRLSGAEVFAMETDANVRLTGVENRRLYEKNLELFRAMHKAAGPITKRSGEWEKTIIQLGNKIYLGDLKIWKTAERSYMAGKMNVMEYAQVLAGLSGCAHPFAQNNNRECNAIQVHEALVRLEERTLRRLLETRPERELFEIEKAFGHLGNLFSFSITRSEWKEILASRTAVHPVYLRRRIAALAREYGLKVELAPISATSFRRALQFYQTAYEREEALLSNTIRVMKQNQISAGVLVAGGFHSEGIRAWARRHGISCISVRPEVKEAGESKYLEVMLGKKEILPDTLITKMLAAPSSFDLGQAHPPLGKMITRTLLRSGRHIADSPGFRGNPEAFIAALEQNLRRALQEGIFENLAGLHPQAVEVSGGLAPHREVLQILFAENPANEKGNRFSIHIPLDGNIAPTLTLSTLHANSLGETAVADRPHFGLSMPNKVALWGFRSGISKTTAVWLTGKEKDVHVDLYELKKNFKPGDNRDHESDRAQRLG